MLQKLFYLVFLLFSININGQVNYSFDYYGQKQGLFVNEIFCTATTSNGMVWLSTNSGLIKYNSKTFKNFSHNINDSTSIADNYCTKIIIDKHDNIWIAAGDNLDVMESKTETIKHIDSVYNPNIKKQIKIKPICFYYNKQKDILFIGTLDGLYFVKNGNKKPEHISKYYAALNVNKPVSCITMDKDENLYFANKNNLHCYNNNLQKEEIIEINKTIQNKPLPPNYITALCLYTTKNKLYIGLYAEGLLEYDIATNKSNRYLYANRSDNDNYVSSIIENISNEKKIWTTTLNYGIASFDTNTKQFEFFKNNDNKYTVNGNLYNLHYNKNALWISTTVGLYKLDFNKQIFAEQKIKYPTATDKVTASIIQIEKTEENKDKIAWLFVPYVGGFKHNLVTSVTSTMPANLQKYFNASVLDFIIDHNNNAWIATVEYGLVRVDNKQSSILTTKLTDIENKKTLLLKIVEDANGNIWCGTTNGLFKYNNLNNKLENVNEVSNFLETNKTSNYIENITFDLSGNLWITLDGSDEKNAAIVKYNPKTKKCNLIFDEKIDIPKSHTPIFLRDIAISKKNELFVVMRGYGIMYFENANVKKIQYITQQNDLPNLYIEKLLLDDKERLWCTSQDGIFYYSLKNKNFIKFNNTNLNISNSFNGDLHISKNTKILFISKNNSITQLNESLVNANDAKNVLLFESFNVFGQTIVNNLQNNQTIKLNHNQNSISISFALLNYTNSDENKYQWKLEGIDKNWNYSFNNIANYNLLKPGTYTLLVKAANNSGINAANALKLKIIIKPPFYKTWWFVLMCILAIAAIVYWFVKARLRRLTEKYLLQNKIASDLHDEVGSTLTSINILSNISQQAVHSKPEQAMQMLQKISMQSKTIQQNISDIVWSIRRENETGESLFTRMREFASQTLEPLNIEFTINITTDLANKILSMQIRRELLLIFKEAISNIVKHAQATKVNIEVAKNNFNYTLFVQDNGTWKGANSGTGVKSIAERAKTLGGNAVIQQNEIGTLVTINFKVT